MQYLSFCDWPVSLSTRSSVRPGCGVYHNVQPLESHALLRGVHISHLLIYSSVHGRLDHFGILAAATIALGNVGDESL